MKHLRHHGPSHPPNDLDPRSSTKSPEDLAVQIFGSRVLSLGNPDQAFPAKRCDVAAEIQGSRAKHPVPRDFRDGSPSGTFEAHGRLLGQAVAYLLPTKSHELKGFRVYL